MATAKEILADCEAALEEQFAMPESAVHIKDAAKRPAAIEEAIYPLRAAFEKNPSLASMGTEQAQDLVLETHTKLIAGEKIDQAAFETAAKKVAATAANIAKPAAAAEAGWFKRNAAKLGDIINKGGKYSPAVVAGGTVLTACLWPSKTEDVTKDDGTTETTKKWGFGKKAAVTVGAIISAALIAEHIPGPTKGWVDKVLGSKAIAKGADGMARG